MVYFIAILYCLILIYSYDIKHTKRGFQFHYYALLAYVVCVVGFSYRLGMDSVGYSVYFDRMDTDIRYVLKHIDEYRYEPLYVILECITKNIWNDFACLQVVVALFVNGTLFWFLRKHSPMFFFSILVYFIYNFWNFNFEIKRESIAVSFFLIAIDQLLSNQNTWKSYLKYVLFCVPVFLSHKFGFFVLLFPLCFKLRITKSFYISLAVFFVISLAASSYFKEFLLTVSKLLNIYGQEAGTGYLNSEIYGEGGLSIIGLITGIILPMMVIHGANRKCTPRIMSLSLFWVIVIILQSEVFIFYRLTNYLLPFVFVSYAYAFERIIRKEANNVIYALIMFAVLFVQVYGRTHKIMYIRYYPYSSIFTKEINNEREAEFDRIDFEFNY